MSTLGYILLGIKRVQATTGACAPRPRLSITAAIMRVLKHSWEAHGASFKHQMLWAACCMCFHGFLRSGEATVPTQAAYDPAIHLSIADVLVDAASEPRTVIVHITVGSSQTATSYTNVVSSHIPVNISSSVQPKVPSRDDSRASNVILFGLPEGKSIFESITVVDEVFEFLAGWLVLIKDIFCLGKFNQSSRLRPLLVKLSATLDKKLLRLLRVKRIFVTLRSSVFFA